MVTKRKLDKPLTLPEKLLLAICGLPSPFLLEAMIVACWKHYPESFCLAGFPEYPDSNKIKVALMSKSGPLGRGLLAQVGQKLYAVTPAGREEVRRLSPRERLPDEKVTITLPPDLADLVQSLVSSSAFQKHASGDWVNFADACLWWGITERTNGDYLDECINTVRNGLNEVEQVVGKRASLGAASVSDLKKLNAHLLERFDRHLALLRNRAVREKAGAV
jgi:hypothetical protein